MGFGDTQVPGPLPPLVNASSQPSTETDLTYIAPPPGPVYPLYVCHDRASHPLDADARGMGSATNVRRILSTSAVAYRL